MGAGTGGGADAKCYSLPQLEFLGFATPPTVTASILPVGVSKTYTLGVVWRRLEGLKIDISSFGGSSFSSYYYICLQADSGPNASLRDMWMYTTSGLVPEIWRKVVEIYQFPWAAPNDLTAGRLAVLGANSQWTLVGKALCWTSTKIPFYRYCWRKAN